MRISTSNGCRVKEYQRHYGNFGGVLKYGFEKVNWRSLVEGSGDGSEMNLLWEVLGPVL